MEEKSNEILSKIDKKIKENKLNNFEIISKLK